MRCRRRDLACGASAGTAAMLFSSSRPGFEVLAYDRQYMRRDPSRIPSSPSSIPGSVSEIEVGAEGASDELLADTTGTDGSSTPSGGDRVPAKKSVSRRSDHLREALSELASARSSDHDAQTVSRSADTAEDDTAMKTTNKNAVQGRTKDSKHRNRAHIPADEATAGSALELKGQKAAASSQAQAQAKGTTTTWYVYADYDTTYADSEGTLDPNFGANALTDPVFLESLQTEIRQSTGKSTLTVPENQPGGIEPEQELVVPPTPEVKLVTTGSVLTAMFLGLQLMTLFVLYHIYQEKLMREFGPADKPVNVLPLSSSSSSESDDDDDDDDDSDSSSD